MRLSLLTLFASLAMLRVSGQEQAIAQVHYQFKHMNDSSQRDLFLKDEVVTYLGEKSAYYSSYSSENMKAELNRIQKAPNFDGNIVLERTNSPINRHYILNAEKQEFIELIRVASDQFSVKGDFPVQNWTILEETKDIGGYSCQKATCSFKGRNYTAWFSSELPFSYGPWKLNGLPGLILSAVDDKNEVFFEYAGFDKLSDEKPVSIAIPENSVASSLSEVLKLEKAFNDNPQAYFAAQANKPSANGRIVVGGKPSALSSNPGGIKSVSIRNADNYKPSKVTNNPIELIP